MSKLRRFKAIGIIHAVIRSDTTGIPDWFAICLKQSTKKIYRYNDGIIKISACHFYVYDLDKEDVHEFYKMVHEGYYVEVFRRVFGIAYEPKEQNLQNYIKKLPIKKQRKRYDTNGILTTSKKNCL